MGWWIALGIFVLLMILPIGVCVRYDSDGPLIKAIVGFIRFTVFPRKSKKPKKEKKKKETKAPPAQPEEQPAQPPKPAPKAEKPPAKKAEGKKGGSVLDFIPLVKIGLQLIGELFSKTIHMDVLEVNLVMGGGDPCDLAVNYGKAWAALGNLWPYLQRMFTIKRRDIQIQCDFTADETLVTARIDITLTLGRLLWAVLRYGVKALIAFLKINKKRKAAAGKPARQT